MLLNLVNPFPLITPSANQYGMSRKATHRRREQQLPALFRMRNRLLAATDRPQAGRWPDAMGFAPITRWPRAQAGPRQVAEGNPGGAASGRLVGGCAGLLHEIDSLRWLSPGA